MLQYLGIGFLIWLISELFDEKGEPTFTVSPRSDCSKEFNDFAINLDLTAGKKKSLNDSKAVIRRKIEEYFKVIYWNVDGRAWRALPTFFIQGSYKHGTSIRTQNDICDVDLGVYFQGRPPVSPSTLQQHLYKALVGHTTMPVSIRNKCVRIKYANFFHIDLPIYYCDPVSGKHFLGVKDQWIESDPKEFTYWVEKHIQTNVQLVRLVRYFKAWADHTRRRKSQKMPSGVALTVWIQSFYAKDDREDMAFIKTAYNMFKYLSDTAVDEWKCEMPVKPFDDLLAKLDESQRKKFLETLGRLIQKSQRILASRKKEKALGQWPKIFGKWFPVNNNPYFLLSGRTSNSLDYSH